MKESPIFAKTYDLLVWLIPTTTKFPREQRFVLGKAVQETALLLQEQLIEAALLRGQAEVQTLVKADISLTKLRFYLRLCRDLALLSPKQYQHVAGMVTEVGKLLGGWRKSRDNKR